MNKIYGYFVDGYYGVQNCGHIVVPMNADIESDSISTKIHTETDQAEIDIFQYHSDMTTQCNVDRVANFKQYLLSEKIKEILEVNRDYIVGVTYELYNKDGHLIKNGEMKVASKFCKALINAPVKEDNTLEYREAFVFDGRLEIPIPQIARYGIKNAYSQHPYTVRFTKVAVYSTIGKKGFIQDVDEQINTSEGVAGTSMNYHCHRPDDLSFNNFANHFLTNAPVGTTMIDSVVVSKVIDNKEVDYTIIPLVEIPITGNKYAIKIDAKINLIVVNLEVLMDNYLEVFSKEDIDEILKLNMSECVEDLPDDNENSSSGSGCQICPGECVCGMTGEDENNDQNSGEDTDNSEDTNSGESSNNEENDEENGEEETSGSESSELEDTDNETEEESNNGSSEEDNQNEENEIE